MCRRTRSLAVLTAMVFAVASVALGATSTSTRRTTRDRDRKPSRYWVIRVLTAEGETKFETVGDTDYRDKEKEYEEQYKQNLLDWAKARKEAQKNKDEFTQKKPVGPRLVQKVKSYKEESDAQEYADKLQQAWDEALAKKRAKEGEGGDILKDDKKGKDEEEKDHKKEE